MENPLWRPLMEKCRKKKKKDWIFGENKRNTDKHGIVGLCGG